VKKLLVGSFAVVALVAAGCGADDAEEKVNSAAQEARSIASDAQSQAESVASKAESQAESVASQAESVAEEATGRVRRVSMKDIKFIPADITVTAGEKVTWSNDDPVAHTATADNGEFDSGTMPSGDTFAWTAEGSGEIPYFCEIHPNQKGTITIE
jgi:plastocyanin